MVDRIAGSGEGSTLAALVEPNMRAVTVRVNDVIGVAGFIIASTLLFVCTALAFGSRNVARDAAIGFALAFVAYVGFDRVLGYKIGSGLIEGLL